MIANATQQGTSFNIIHRDTMFKVDVFIPPPDPFQQSQFERAQQQSFSLERERSANFASPEDIILSKLDWSRKRVRLHGSKPSWRIIYCWISNITGAEMTIYSSSGRCKFTVEDRHFV